MNRPENIISIHGVPRSGTSWLGHIFNSSEEVAFRYQPLFSYRYKHFLKLDTPTEEMKAFFKELYELEYDEFIFLGEHQLRLENGEYYNFQKQTEAPFLVMKMVRYHYLVEQFLKKIPNMKVVGIVRNPKAVINSWMKAPKEFEPDWDHLNEWKLAEKKNLGRAEEYYGFEKWKEISNNFLRFLEEYPDKFYLVKYEELVENTLEETQKMFDFCGIKVSDQVKSFINQSQSKEIESHPYSVFRKKTVKDKWQSQLDPRIKEVIDEDLKATPLEFFL